MTEAFKWVAHGGKLVYVGLVKEHIAFFDPDFQAKELTLFASRNTTKEDFNTVMAALSSQKIDANAYSTKRIAFEETISYFKDKFVFKLEYIEQKYYVQYIQIKN